MFPHLLDFLVNFFDSSFFLAIVTVAVGWAAYGVYARQKRDAKRDAANIVLLEIENAERLLDKVSTSRPFTDVDEDDVYLMETASWDKYKYLFVRDFDRNEWDKISNFYAKCQAYDAAVRFHKVSITKNQQTVRANLQRILADHTKRYVDQLDCPPSGVALADLERAYLAKRNKYVECLVGDSASIFTYVPKQAESDAKKALNNLETSLSLTSVGVKLKGIVSQKQR